MKNTVVGIDSRLGIAGKIKNNVSIWSLQIKTWKEKRLKKWTEYHDLWDNIKWAENLDAQKVNVA